MTAPTPGLDVAALTRRLRALSSILDEASEGEADDATAAFVLYRKSILAALEEREGLRTRVAALEILLRDTDTQLWQWTMGNGVDPEWRPLSVREQHRVNGLLLAAREAEEVSGDG